MAPDDDCEEDPSLRLLSSFVSCCDLSFHLDFKHANLYIFLLNSLNN